MRRKLTHPHSPVGATHGSPVHMQRDLSVDAPRHRAGYILRLQRAMILTLCLSSLAIALVSLAGRALGRADDPRALHFDLCAQRPCVLGMTPGSTTWGEAAALLARFPIDAFDDKRVYTLLPGVSVETYISVNAQTVGRVYLSFPSQAPLSAGWVIQRYGTPCGVSIYTSGDLVTLRYPLLLANVRIGDGQLTMDAPVSAIRFSDPAFDFESQPDPCVDNITSRQMLNTHWQGFTPVALYWERG